MKKKLIIIFIYLFFLIFIYHQVIHFNFVNFDDQDYVTENVHIQKGLTFESIRWAFSLHDNNLTYWHPLAYVAHMVDYSLFGMQPGLHHLSNLFLHFINTVLLFIVLYSLTGAFYRSFFVALIFSIHPIAVDSVAWVAQKKTLLATTFWLLTILSHKQFALKGGAKRYILTLLTVTAGLLTKPLMVTIPFVLLLIDFWPLGRIEGVYLDPVYHHGNVKKHTFTYLVIEKIPFAILVMLWGITPLIQKHVTAKNISLDVVPFGLRFSNAVVSYFMYVKNLFFPHNLAFLYPYPDHVSLFYTVLAVITLFVIFSLSFLFKNRYPFFTFGWFLFAMALIPFLGFVQGAVWPAYADRFAYMPFIGLYVIVVWGAYEFICRFNIPQIVYVSATAIVVAILSVMTFIQTGYWKDNFSLYRHALVVTQNNYLAYNNLGVAYFENGDLDDAQKNYEMALLINPGYSKTHFNLAVTYLKLGQVGPAVEHFLISIHSNPDNPVAKYNLGNIAMANGRFEQAMDFYSGALADKPDFSDAHNNLGVILSKQGSKIAAMEHFKQALIDNPANIDALCNLGNELFDVNRIDDSIVCFSRAYTLDPKNIRVLNDFGVVYAAMGRQEDAEKLFQEILVMDPQNPSALANLDKVKADMKGIERNLANARESISQKPGDISSLLKYAGLCMTYAHDKDAEDTYLKVLSLDPCSVDSLRNLAGLCEKTGQYYQAVVYYNRMASCRDDLKANAYYSIACVHSLEKKEDDAVKWLQKAADSGFNDWNRLMTDRRFDTIRTTKPFREFLSVVYMKN